MFIVKLVFKWHVGAPNNVILGAKYARTVSVCRVVGILVAIMFKDNTISSGKKSTEEFNRQFTPHSDLDDKSTQSVAVESLMYDLGNHHYGFRK